MKCKSISSLFSFLQRRYPDILSVNPCKGNRITRPEKNKYIDRSFPSSDDISILLNYLTGLNKLVLILLIEQGLRITGLYNIKIDVKNKSFQTLTKGKILTGKLTEKSLTYLLSSKENGLIKDVKNPFTSTLAEKTLIKHFKQEQGKLVREKKLNQIFTPHKFRSYFTSKLYLQSKDIYLCKKSLGHSSIVSTEIYLQGLNVL
jgi:integrase